MKRLGIRMNLLINQLLGKSFYFMSGLIVILHLVLSFIICLSLNKIYSTLAWIAFNTIWLVFAIHLTAYNNCGLILWFMSTYYLKLKFNEINDRIELSLKNSNLNQLLYAIREHNNYEIITKRLNHFFRLILFIIIYISTIIYQLCLILVNKKDTTLLGRIIFGLIFLLFFWINLFVVKMNTWVSISAHKPYKTLFSISNNKRVITKTYHRLKLLSFIEKLSGPEIGFYCYDLFPMDSYHFYQYLYIIGQNYILILNKLS